MRFPIPNDALDDRLATVGTAGAGKTYAMLGMFARLLKNGARCIGFDALGVMWGIRLMPDGKTPSPFQIPIFGGPHGDLPLNEHAGALVGETIATMRESCIIDISEIGPKASERRFMLALLTALYRHANKEPVHLLIDEADMWAPQSVAGDKEGEAPKLLGMMETVVRRGRVKGFIPWLITQRPAVLNKNVLSQADGIIAMKLTAKQDHDAVAGWIEATADKALWNEIKATLPTKQRGEGVIWIPGRGILSHVTFPENETFDSSRAPKRGVRHRATEMPPLDLGKLKERLSTVEAEVKANDPAALKSELARARRELAVAKASPSAPTDAKAKSYAADARVSATAIRELRKGLEAAVKFIVEINTRGFFKAAGEHVDKAAIEKVIAEATERATRLIESHITRREKELETVRAASERLLSRLRELVDADVSVQVDVTANEPFTMKPAPSLPRRPVGSNPARSDNGSLPIGERAVLIAAAQFGTVERTQLTILTGYKRSTRDAYVARLREKGYVDLDGSSVLPTDAGVNALGDFEPLPQGEELQAYWLARLPEGERKILEELIAAYPKPVDNDALSESTGYKRSTRDAYLSRMEAKRIIARGRGETAAARELFE